MRKLLKCKRKSKPHVDEVQDGGRAQAIEEGVSALVFTYAQNHDFLIDVQSVDSDLLRTIKGMTHTWKFLPALRVNGNKSF